MNVLSVNGQVFDLDQVRSTCVQEGSVELTFRNGDHISLHWRDDAERKDILRMLAPEAGAASVGAVPPQ